MPVIENALVPPSRPPNHCNMDGWDLIVAALTGSQIKSPVTFDNLVISFDKPGPNERHKAWFRLNVDLSPENGFALYKWWNSRWVAPIWPRASSSFRMFWVGSEADLWAEDGGDGTNPAVTAPTAISGAVWQADPAFVGRTAIGAGEIPGSNPPIVVAPGNDYGAAQSVLTESTMPKHFHYVFHGTQANFGAQGVVGPTHSAARAGGNFNNTDYAILGWDDPQGARKANVGQSSESGEATADQAPIVHIPPSHGGIWAMRTVRRFKVVA